MVTSYRIRLDAVEELAVSLATAVDAIGDELATLDSEVVRLRAGWSGQAAEAYSRAHEDWTDSMRALHELLAQAGAAASGAAERHRAAVEASAQRWT